MKSKINFKNNPQLRNCLFFTFNIGHAPDAEGGNHMTLNRNESKRTIENEMLQAVNTGDVATAKTDANQLEHDWDQAAPKLRKIDRKTWTQIDGTIDDVLAATRAKKPNEGKCQSVLQDSLDSLNQANA
ncbi:hypothetical protein [Cohnella sp. GCM10012308]|uniref:hypothetical protein n=1 Tax=Cohnella sp. GCM10012308 TaxID=3317329 RepID=UPI00361EAE4F